MAKTMITVAPTGAWPMKEHNPAVPLTPREIADEVYACWQAGAAIAHLHMRDEKGQGTMSKARFIETVGLIREKCDIVLNLTTSGDLNATRVLCACLQSSGSDGHWLAMSSNGRHFG